MRLLLIFSYIYEILGAITKIFSSVISLNKMHHVKEDSSILHLLRSNDSNVVCWLWANQATIAPPPQYINTRLVYCYYSLTDYYN